MAVGKGDRPVLAVVPFGVMALELVWLVWNAPSQLIWASKGFCSIPHMQTCSLGASRVRGNPPCPIGCPPHFCLHSLFSFWSPPCWVPHARPGDSMECVGMDALAKGHGSGGPKVLSRALRRWDLHWQQIQEVGQSGIVQSHHEPKPHRKAPKAQT